MKLFEKKETPLFKPMIPSDTSIDLVRIREVLKNPAGEDLLKYLIVKVDTLRDISHLKRLDETGVLAHLLAYTVVSEMVRDLTSMKGEVKPKDPRDSYT